MPDAFPDAPSLRDLAAFMEHSPLTLFRGIEKEGLRFDSEKKIAQSDHPRTLGHPLTHPHITTDYSEALLELITGVHKDRDDLIRELEEVHRFVHSHLGDKRLGDEGLWAGSMPCQLEGEDSIRIAEYGDSNIGHLKYVYRKGLEVRYGKTMQSIAGLHFNFSVDDSYWEYLRQSHRGDQSLKDFKSKMYFSLIRNFRRHAWLLMYLFGASPALDKSFVNGRSNHGLALARDQETLYKPHATSLRMGDLGYQNNAQSELNICFNTVENFTATLSKAISTPYGPYEDIGLHNGEEHLQLNANILQIENEYYSVIRPKRTAQSGEKPTQALQSRGVEYIEVRCLDLNPYLPLGIDAQQVDFMDLFLLHCLHQPAPWIADAECEAMSEAFAQVVEQGRDPGLDLVIDGQTGNFQSHAERLLNAMQPLAHLLDQQYDDQRYSQALAAQLAKLSAEGGLPSERVLNDLAAHQLSWREWVGKLSSEHGEALKGQPYDESFDASVANSISEAVAIKASDSESFDDFLVSYISQ